MDKLIYCLGADPRPTCVLQSDALQHVPPRIHYQNKPLQAQSHLLHDILDPAEATVLQPWALNTQHSGTVTAPGGAVLHAYTVEKRWRIIQWLLPEKQNGQKYLKERTSPRSPKGDPLALNRKL